MPANLLTLPYDIRFLIYQQLFPPDEQLYIQANDTTLQSMWAEGLPTQVILVSRQMHAEVSGYLYNTYLFNIVGTKKDCLANYQLLVAPLRKYGRSSVHVDAFSNGEHSATMCISLQAGDAKSGVLDRRGRGQRMTILAMQEELDAKRHAPWYEGSLIGYSAVCGVLCALVACLSWL